METTKRHFCRTRFCFIFPMVIIAIFAVSGIVMLLWNAIIPGISTFSALTYWQAMGMFILSRILFGGFRFASHHHGHRPPFVHDRFKERFMDMSDEERLQFKNQWKQRCCNK